MVKRYGIFLLVALVLTIASNSAAAGMTPAPGWEVTGWALPTNLPPNGEGVIRLYIYNTGGAPGENAVLTDELPQGLVATRIQFFGGGGNPAPNDCLGTTVVKCTLNTNAEEA